MREDLGVHETLEIHELLTFKSLCLTKSLIMQIMVTDEKLKKILQDDVHKSTGHVEDLRKHLTSTEVSE